VTKLSCLQQTQRQDAPQTLTSQSSS
jgi:hypothetical protein